MGDNEFPADVQAKIYPGASPRHRVPDPSPINEFAPWHLPRKQWVRQKQWAAQVRRLVSKNNIAEDRPIRYLTLPGNDLLDIQAIGRECADMNRDLRYLGFHSSLSHADNQSRVALAEDLVRSQTRIDHRSLTVDHDILTLASKKSIAWQHVRKFESFDVINLDVCDAFATRPQRSSHEAVQHILDHQLNGRRQPWLLFITSSCDSGSIPPEDLVRYLSIIEENMLSDEFSVALTAALGENATQVIEGVRNNRGDINVAGILAKLFSVGLGKWLSKCVLSNNWQVSMPSAACYRRSVATGDATKIPSHPELVSLVFRFDARQQALVDPTSFAAIGTSTGSDSATQTAEIDTGLEKSSALGFAKRLEKLRDLDEMFATELSEDEIIEYENETASYLKDRNYDMAAYGEFIQNAHRHAAGSSEH